MHKNTLYSALAMAGTIPFIACAILPWFGIESLWILGRLDVVASTYGLAIVSFMAGAHWGTDLSGQTIPKTNLFVTSNVILLAVWAAFIAADVKWALAVQIAALLVLLYIDRGLKESAVISARYFKIRLMATVIATLSLGIILLG